MAGKIVRDTAGQAFSEFLSSVRPIKLDRIKSAFLEHWNNVQLFGAVVAASLYEMVGIEPADLIAFWLLAKVEGQELPDDFDTAGEAAWALALTYLKVEEPP